MGTKKWNNYFIVTGIVDVQDFSSKRKKAEVENVIIHKDYNNDPLYNDIAIIKLKTPLKFNENVQPACLPDPDTIPEENGNIGFVSGWGSSTERKYLL